MQVIKRDTTSSRWLFWLFCMGWYLLPQQVHAQVTPTLPDALKEFVAQARGVLLTGQPDAIRPLASPPDALTWRGQPGAWELAVLPLPKPLDWTADKIDYLAVFSRFHGVQATADFVCTLKKANSGWQFDKEIPETETFGYRIQEHRFDVHLDIPHTAATFTDVVTIERTNKASTVCLLRLSKDMQVEAISGDKDTLLAAYVPGLIAIALPPGKRFTLTFSYHRVPMANGGDTLSPAGAVLLSYWYPHIARLPARHRITVSIPKGWTAVCQGELLRQTNTEQESRFSFQNAVPTTYLAIVAGPYSVTKRIVSGRTLAVYQLHPNKVQAEQVLSEAGKVLVFFEKAFGKFPYTHYDLVETPGEGSALESYSFAIFSGDDWPIAHELAHTWWGGIVSNPYTTSLWSESFAEYSASLFLRQGKTPTLPAVQGLHAGPDFGRSYQQRFTVPIADAWDLVSHFGHSAAGYVKGPLVLGMLEDMLGTETMMRCLRRFCTDHKSGSVGDWSEFARAVDKVTGRNYNWFFDQWIKRAGAPVVAMSSVIQKPDGNRFVIDGRIVQESSPYRLRIPVTVALANGETMREMIEVSGKESTFRLSCPAVPLSLRLDPDGSLLMAGKATDEKTDPFLWKFAESTYPVPH